VAFGGALPASRGIHVYVYDRHDQTTTLAHVSDEGEEGNGRAGSKALSADGRLVVFSSTASNLVPGDTNQVEDIFAHDHWGGWPQVFGIAPATGASAGGTRVTLTGIALSGVTSVTLGGVPATSVVVGSDASLSFAAPAGPAGTLVDLEVRTSGGASDAVRAGFAFSALVPLDVDGDGLDDEWERQFGLLASLGSGNDSAWGDPDGDGVTNLEERVRGTHPRGFFTRFFAEGSTGMFETEVALANPGATEALVLVRFQREDGEEVPVWRALPAQQHVVLRSSEVAGLAGSSFATVVESDVEVVATRTMVWDVADASYGMHVESSLAEPARRWYLAEGATHSGFELFYLLQNPDPAPARVRIRYLLPAPHAPISREYDVAGRSRRTIPVHLEPGLSGTDVSAVVEVLSGPAVVVERAMYAPGQGRRFLAGHASTGVLEPATQWIFAEGATLWEFDLYLLLANPTGTEAQVRVEYLFAAGPPEVRTYAVAAESRRTIWVDGEGTRLADAAVGMKVTSTNRVPILAERSMWWPGGPGRWHEGHNSPGTRVSGQRWGVAGGVVTGPPFDVETYLLVANTSASDADVRVTLLFEDGAPPMPRDFALAGASRLTIRVRDDFPQAVDRRFAAVVESLSRAQLVVEVAKYNNALGLFWVGGGSALATLLP
jgi:hypothetical protein